jgi:hypothetical protein
MSRFALVAVFALTFAGTAAAQPPDLSGRWSGEWISDKNGHHGPLHGRFRQLDADTYRVAFRGRFAKVVPFWYTTKLQVVGAGDGVVVLAASQRLPLVGEYRTTALATAANFDATFSSAKDSGRFVLARRASRR